MNASIRPLGPTERTSATAFAHAAFPTWAFWLPQRPLQRRMFAAIISRDPSSVAWDWELEENGIDRDVRVKNEAFPELGVVRIPPFFARRLACFGARNHDDPTVRRIAFEAVSGLRRLLTNLPPGGLSHAALRGQRIDPLSDDLSLALAAFPPPDTDLVAAPDPQDPSVLISRGVRVCSVEQAAILAQRRHVLAMPEGGYKRF